MFTQTRNLSDIKALNESAPPPRSKIRFKIFRISLSIIILMPILRLRAECRAEYGVFASRPLRPRRR